MRLALLRLSGAIAIKLVEDCTNSHAEEHRGAREASTLDTELQATGECREQEKVSPKEEHACWSSNVKQLALKTHTQQSYEA